MHEKPVHLDLKKREGLVVEWPDGTKSHYPIEYLRKMSPSAETRHLREEIARNPLTVLPASVTAHPGPITAVGGSSATATITPTACASINFCRSSCSECPASDAEFAMTKPARPEALSDELPRMPVQQCLDRIP